MAHRLNAQFRSSPQAFLDRYVLRTETVSEQSGTRMLRAKTISFFDLQPRGKTVALRVVPGLHAYADAPISGYFLETGGIVTLPIVDSPHSICFLHFFEGVKLQVFAEGDALLRILHQQETAPGLAPRSASADGELIYTLSSTECLKLDIPAEIRAAAILHKPVGEPWILLVQQSVGVSGSEFVYRTVRRPLALT
jgi:hypothetical protein